MSHVIKDRTQKFSLVAAVIAAVVVLCAAYAYFIEPNRLVVTAETLKIAGWNSAFARLKIVAISDIHGGSNGGSVEHIREVVTAANEQNADLVVLLGDYVTPGSGPLGLKMLPEDVASALAGLHAKYGVYAVLGNHDGDSDAGRIKAALTADGYKVLDGEVATIERNGAKLRILGTKDHQSITYWRNYADDNKALLAPTEGTGDVLVLQHSPDIVPVITGEFQISNDLKLMLAGHTHGGQVSLPVVGPPLVPSSYGQKYARGLVHQNGLDIFITSGVGTSILPFRFGVPPEIAVLTIEPK